MVGMSHDPRVVRGDNDRAATFTRRGHQRVENDFGVFGIEVASGLVGQDDSGAEQQRATNRSPLRLPTGNLAWPVMVTGTKPEFGEEFARGVNHVSSTPPGV